MRTELLQNTNTFSHIINDLLLIDAGRFFCIKKLRVFDITAF